METDPVVSHTDPTSAELSAYYAKRAPYYDAVYFKPERRADISFLRSHLPSRLRQKSVLEVACGTGFWTQYIAAETLRMVSSDATAEPLELARMRPGVDRVRFVQANAYALPAELGVFDAAFAGLWFSHVPIGSRLAFLHSLHARLRPGARVLFMDNNTVQLRDFPITGSDAEGNTYQYRTLRDGSVHRVLKNFPTEGELRELLSSHARRIEFRSLDNFWLLEYELNSAAN